MPVSEAMSTADGEKMEVDGTTNGDILRDVGSTDGAPIVDPSGSGKSDPPSC